LPQYRPFFNEWTGGGEKRRRGEEKSEKRTVLGISGSD